MEAATSRSDDSAVTQEYKAPVNTTATFLKNFEQAIAKSEVQSPEREMWLHGITQIDQNPILLKTLETALKATFWQQTFLNFDKNCSWMAIVYL